MGTQTLDNVVRIDTTVSSRSALRKGFDIGLILGASNRFSNGDRIRIYNRNDALQNMIFDGFTMNDPEYEAVQLYFSQDKKPNCVVVGSIQENESILDALIACEAASSDWYALYICGLNDTDVEDIAKYIEASNHILFHVSDDDSIKDGTSGNIFEKLKDLRLKRTFLQFSTQEHACVAIMGYALGSVTLIANSAFTAKFKKEIGVQSEDVAPAQISNIQRNNGNLYLNYAETYNFLSEGIMADGSWLDEIIYLDIFVNDLQLSVLDLLVGTNKIPQTESGIASIISALDAPCRKMVNVGFIASSGIWNGESILQLQKGDMLPNGYRIMSEPIYSQSQADRDTRICPPIYIAVKLAGAIHSVIIGLQVNR